MKDRVGLVAGAYLLTEPCEHGLMFQPCLERPKIRFGLLQGAARGGGTNLADRFYRPLGEDSFEPGAAAGHTEDGSNKFSLRLE